MSKKRIAQKGDVYWINPNPVAGREMKDGHRYIVITPKEINKLGVVMTVPVTSGGSFARATGLTIPISGCDTSGVAVCNQVRTFDIEERERTGTAKFVESLDAHLTAVIINRVISVIDPADE